MKLSILCLTLIATFAFASRMLSSVKIDGKMTAYALEEAGGNDKFQRVELDIPTPGDRDVLVRNYASATNPVDSFMRSTFGAAMGVTPPGKYLTIGYDAAGIVQSVGAKVRNFKKGDHVYFAGDVTRNGTFAEYTVVDERIVGRKPESLSWEESAAMPLVTATAMEALYESLAITEDKVLNRNKTLLIINGAGGVGSIAIQIAKKLLGLTVIATASREETATYCKKLGADFIINHRKNLQEQLEALPLKSKTVEYIFAAHDPTEYFNTFPNLLSPLGKVVSIMAPSKPLDIAPFMSKRLSFIFELMFTRSRLGVEPEKQGALLNKASKMFDQKVFVSTVSNVYTFDLTGLREAMELQDSRSGTGKNVLCWPKTH
ncbi:zinc-type alcohol dehydrogenase [Acrasis kona]|uniref:Zinc-type alcohol dehydrogenase n=1 Tax=Acrasis kona TaxID=1008807 RepID=A0AAW2YW86_9EUKA